MQWFYNLKIASKLFLATALSLMTICFIGLFSVFQLTHLNQSTTQITDQLLPAQESLLQIKGTTREIAQFQREYLYPPPDTIAAAAEAEMGMRMANFEESLEVLARIAATGGQKQAFDTLQNAFQAFKEANNAMVGKLGYDRVPGNTVTLDNTTIKELAAMNAAVDAFSEQITQFSNSIKANADTVYDRSRALILSLIALCIVAGIGFSIWIARMISGQLTTALNIARQVASGDLTAEIRATSKDEVGQLIDSLRTMNDNLCKLVGQIHNGAKLIHEASNEITSGNMDLSDRTERQASALEQTASAMEQLTATVSQNADNAHQANKLAINASEVAATGGKVMDKVIKTMGSINESSTRIVDIIAVIDGIAFQTNILALNAAVEAARAGEQGRGFAVVASEVRSLAQRSASAAKEIKDLIDNSVEKVGAGSRLVEQAGSTMQEVVTSISRVTDIVSEITAASVEQSTGIKGINQAVSQMESATQQNAALVEEATAATKSMEDQAGKLMRAVNLFKIDDTTLSVRDELYAKSKEEVRKVVPQRKSKLAQMLAAQQSTEEKKAASRFASVPSATPPVQARTATERAPLPAPAIAGQADDGDWTEF